MKGLPEIDVPWFELDPRSCKRCCHSFYDSKDRELRYLRCGRGPYGQQCRYERHDDGDCKREGVHFKERGA